MPTSAVGYSRAAASQVRNPILSRTMVPAEYATLFRSMVNESAGTRARVGIHPRRHITRGDFTTGVSTAR